MNARLDSIASEKRAGTDKPARQFNQGRKWYNPPGNPQGDKANSGNCYGCGEPGHYKRNCPKLKAHTNSQGTSFPNRADSPVAPGTDTGTNNKGDNNSKRNESRRVTQSQKVTDIKGGYVASGLVQGMPVDLLIDSGSDVTLVDVEIYNQIPESVRPLLSETETNLSTASGSPMTTSGQARFELQLGNSEWSYPFIVAELSLAPTRRFFPASGLCLSLPNICCVGLRQVKQRNELSHLAFLMLSIASLLLKHKQVYALLSSVV